VITLRLPYPPSVNTIWRRVGNKTLLSAQGRAYRQEVGVMVREQTPAAARGLSGRLRVTIHVHAPDRRARDLDNVPKAIHDALTHAGLWVDDSQIDRLLIERCNNFPPSGAVVVVVEEVTPC
jgi:crossover junction endodeoxyribonuclease RusA